MGGNHVGWDKVTSTLTFLSSNSEYNDNSDPFYVPPGANETEVVRKLPTVGARRRRRRQVSNLPIIISDVIVSKTYHAKPLVSEPLLTKRSIKRTRTEIGWNSNRVNVSRESFEVGPFTKSVGTSFIKFRAQGRGLGLAYFLHIAAHCLPDPPRRLDNVGDVGDETKPFFVATQTAASFSSNFDGDKGNPSLSCINLRDTVHCRRFYLRFTANVVHSPVGDASISIVPLGVRSTKERCRY